MPASVISGASYSVVVIRLCTDVGRAALCVLLAWSAARPIYAQASTGFVQGYLQEAAGMRGEGDLAGARSAVERTARFLVKCF